MKDGSGHLYSVRTRLRSRVLLNRVCSVVALSWFGALSILHIAGAEILLASLVPPTILALISLGLSVSIIVAMEVASEQPRTLPVTVLSASREIQLVFFLLILLHVLMSLRPDSYWAESGRLIFLPLYDWLVLILACVAGGTTIVTRNLRWLAEIAFWVLGASILYDLSSPGAFSTLATRAAGFPENSNASAFFSVLLLCVSVRFDKPGLKDMVLVAAAGIFVALTLSRGGAVMYLMVATYLLFRSITTGSITSRANRLALIALVGVAAVGLGGYFLQSEMFSAPAAAQRVAMLSGAKVLDIADESRTKLILHYLELIESSPWLGLGAAYSWAEPKGPHNMFLHLWVSLGLAGLVCFAVFLFSCWLYFRHRKDRVGAAFIFVSVMQAFLSHNMLEQRPWLILLGFLIGSRSEWATRAGGFHRLSTGESESNAPALIRR